MDKDIVCVSGIYAITNTVNGKKYIGSASNLKSRWSRHRSGLNLGTHNSIKLQNSWNQHGADCFVFEVVEFVSSKSDLLSREQLWIDKFSSATCDGYNVMPRAGSSLGYKYPPAFGAAISARKKGIKFSEEHKAKLSAWQVGKKESSETKARKSAALKGRPRAPEVVAKMGRKNSQETIEKRRASLTGLKRSPEVVEKMRLVMLGTKLSPETIAKRTATWRANRLAKQAIKA